MTPRPTRDTPAGQAYNDLRNLARRQDRDVAEYLTLYALEGFLARLALSPQASDFLLKGGVLMAAFADRRPTRDIDLLAFGFTNELAECQDRVRDIASIPLNDGLTFDPSSVRGESIRDEADYTGVRVHLSSTLATAHLGIHIDVNFGDPIWPGPTETELPRLLGGTVQLLSYPDHMVLAEKIVTAIQRGTANTRWRDFVDVDAIARHRPIAEQDLRRSLAMVAQHRGARLHPLAQALAGMADVAQPRWSAWRRRQRLNDTTPENLHDLLDAIIRFADRALADQAASRVWNPPSQEWS